MEPGTMIAIAFGISLVGYFPGRKPGHRTDFPLEIAGGVVLVGIGARILFGHLA